MDTRETTAINGSLKGRDSGQCRKVCLVLSLLIASTSLLLSATTTRAAEIPAAAQKEIDQLVQQDKFTEALAKVDALLKAKPTDKDLLDLKAQLEKSAKPAAPSAPG